MQRGNNPKNVLYVGGLEESINEAILHSAFIPFGEIKDVNIPLDNTTGQHRGFGFVEYEDPVDAADAIDNTHNAELYGRVNTSLQGSSVVQRLEVSRAAQATVWRAAPSFHMVQCRGSARQPECSRSGSKSKSALSGSWLSKHAQNFAWRCLSYCFVLK